MTVYHALICWKSCCIISKHITFVIDAFVKKATKVFEKS